MDQRTILVACVIAAYIAGRYSAPEKIKEVTKTEVKEVEVKNEERAEDKVVTRLLRVKADGTKTYLTSTKTRAKETVQTARQNEARVEQKKEVENRRGVVVSAMAGVPLDKFTTLVYGASVTKQFIGPIHLGAFAFSDLRIGLMVGVEL